MVENNLPENHAEQSSQFDPYRRARRRFLLKISLVLIALAVFLGYWLVRP
jgi:uncharacterized membrane protein YdbT with pleckstrin-like domain